MATMGMNPKRKRIPESENMKTEEGTNRVILKRKIRKHVPFLTGDKGLGREKAKVRWESQDGGGSTTVSGIVTSFLETTTPKPSHSKREFQRSLHFPMI